MRIAKTSLKILIPLAVLVVGLGLALPDSVHVERSISIDAPRATVFVLLNGFESFNRWSPWYELDPQADFTFDGPRQGVGAKMMWSSDRSDVGSGSQAIVASEPYEMVRTRLDFADRGTARATFELEPQGDGTEVTWSLDAELGWDLPGRYFALLLDRRLGAEYERGLANLKEVVESMPRADWSDTNIRVVEVEPVPMAYSDGASSWDQGEIAVALGNAYSRVRAFVAEHELEQSGPPLVVTRLATESEWHFEAGIPIQSAPEIAAGDDDEVFVGETYGGRVVRAIHVGAKEKIRETRAKIDAYIAAHNLTPAGSMWQEWVSDRAVVPEERQITNVCVPIR